MSRMIKTSWVICCAPLLLWAGSAMAGDTGVVGVDAYWVADDGRVQVRQTPAHLVLVHIIGVAENGVLRVECYAGAYKAFRRGEFKPRKGASFEWTSDVLCPEGLDPLEGFGPSEFIVDSGAGRTDSTGVGTFTVTLRPEDLPQFPITHDHVALVTVNFVNKKRVVRTEAGCTISQELP